LEREFWKDADLASGPNQKKGRSGFRNPGHSTIRIGPVAKWYKRFFLKKALWQMEHSEETEGGIGPSKA